MSQDDSVRGNGTSYPSLDILPPKPAENPFDDSIVKFHGNLDYESLGGAGIQPARAGDPVYGWEEVHVLNLKDTVPPAGTSDRASVSWGYDFQLLATTQTEDWSVSADLQRVVVPIKDLVPTLQRQIGEQVGASQRDGDQENQHHD
ncbi:hypothetical protein INS49_015824 [Diaporthe citri]|uniref:uncharacterized protein n=1 Tax=Diaporthe citri TaxID=83186 RepID=UPI001C82444F|nr:uncharacterized protein INS49_015824 [Diaporthe citri]KAG6356436.1 hypothetical protein INS49_015824 [Diaporthe citri]